MKRPLTTKTAPALRHLFLYPFPSPSLWLAPVNFEPNISRVYTPQLQSWVLLLRWTPMKMERLVSSETSALKAQTPGDYTKDTIRHVCVSWSPRIIYFLILCRVMYKNIAAFTCVVERDWEWVFTCQPKTLSQHSYVALTSVVAIYFILAEILSVLHVFGLPQTDSL